MTEPTPNIAAKAGGILVVGRCPDCDFTQNVRSRYFPAPKSALVDAA